MNQPLPFRNLYIGIIQILKSVFEQQRYTDKEIEKTFKENKQWGSRDRSFVAEMVYELVRWKALVNFAANQAIEKDDYWKLIATWFIINDLEIPPLAEFKNYNKDKIKSNYLQSQKIPYIWHSLSEELYAIGKKELGEELWHKNLESMNVPAIPIIRLNSLKTTEKELRKSLKKEEVFLHKIENYPNAFSVKEGTNLFKTEAFQAGSFEMQDAASQQIAPFLEVEPGMRVADTCAGGGGKTLHLAALMQNKGQILAMDIFEWKLKELKKRAKRNGAFNIQVKHIESTKTIKRLHNSFDRLLIDAPCSGVGVLKRNPDAKWKINVEFLESVKKTQQDILKNYSSMLKTRGIMVYATCSIFPSENEKQVEKFLENNPNYELLEQKTLLPSETSFDGFFMAKILKKT